MKQSIGVFLLLATIATFTVPVTAQLLWRNAKTAEKGSFIIMGQWYFSSYSKSYDWSAAEWKNLPNSQKMADWGVETMFGYAITDRWEAMIHLPLLFLSSEMPDVISGTTIKKSASGKGDLYLKTRYALLPWSNKKHGLVLICAFRFPTGDESADIPLGDGGSDLGLGAIFTTKWFNDLHRGHLKLSYWINGENGEEVKIGNQFKLIAKYDYNLSPSFMPVISYIFFTQAETQSNGIKLDRTRKIRHTLTPGVTWKPKSGLFVRPKVTLFLAGEGGNRYSFKPMVDVWYVFKI